MDPTAFSPLKTPEELKRMSDPATVPDDPNSKPKGPRIGSVMVGHAIDNADDSSMVCVAVNGEAARLSVEGARIVADQIKTWADHAEERNKARPGERVSKFIFHVMEKADALDPAAAKTPEELKCM